MTCPCKDIGQYGCEMCLAFTPMKLGTKETNMKEKTVKRFGEFGLEEMVRPINSGQPYASVLYWLNNFEKDVAHFWSHEWELAPQPEKSVTITRKQLWDAATSLKYNQYQELCERLGL